NEMKGIGNSLDFGARMLDSRVGRWFTVDPFASKYPDLSPYSFVANSPLIYIDPDGEKIINADKIRKEKSAADIKIVSDALVKAAASFGSIDKRKDFKGDRRQWQYVKLLQGRLK